MATQKEREELALALYEQGVDTHVIAERLGVARPSVNRMIAAARNRRATNA